MAGQQTQVRPNYGPLPSGKANIMKQGQTHDSSNAWGADHMATTKVPGPQDNPPL
jgi:hypothetical protein